MTPENLAAALLRLPIFTGIKPSHLALITQTAERVKYLPGEVITKAGQPGDAAYVVLTGAAQRVAGPGAAAPTEDITPGSLIGEMAMLIEHDYTATVIARDRVFCLKVLRSAVHAQMLADPTLAQHFHDRVSEQLKRTVDELRRIDKDFAAQPFPTKKGAAKVQAAPAKFVAATYGRQ
jgi:CRP-like cAMP-binding protein